MSSKIKIKGSIGVSNLTEELERRLRLTAKRDDIPVANLCRHCLDKALPTMEELADV